MKIFLSCKNWLRLLLLTFTLLLLIAPSCGVAGGPEIVCQGRLADLVTLRSLKVTIKNPAARSSAIGCITAAKLPTANTVSVNMHTFLGVKGRSFAVSMGDGNSFGLLVVVLPPISV